MSLKCLIQNKIKQLDLHRKKLEVARGGGWGLGKMG